MLLGVGGVLCYKLYSMHSKRITAGIRAFMYPDETFETQQSDCEEIEEVRIVV